MASLGRDDRLPLRPVRIRCYHFDKAFGFAFHSPQTKRLQADSVIVRVDFSDGSTGFGESAPRPYVTGENCRSVVDLIVGQFAAILFKQSIASIDAAETVLNELEASCRQKGLTAYHSALGAVDLAMLTALAAKDGIFCHQGFLPPCRDALRMSLSVPFLPREAIQSYFPRVRSNVAISVVKVLVSEDVGETCERVALIRGLFGTDTELRIEFNGKMTLRQVEDLLERLSPFDVRAVEQPLPTGELGGLARLRNRFNIHLVADESLVTQEDAERLARHGAYDIFNIKVSKCGGLLKSLRIAQLAAQYGIPCQIGTHVGESDLLGRAGRRLARSIQNFDCYGGGSEVLFSRLLEANRPDGEDLSECDAWIGLVQGLQPIAEIEHGGAPA